MRYNLPPTDPRVEEATDEEIVQDLLVLHFHGQKVEETADPNVALEADLVANPDVFKALERAADTLPRLAPPKPPRRRRVAP